MTDKDKKLLSELTISSLTSILEKENLYKQLLEQLHDPDREVYSKNIKTDKEVLTNILKNLDWETLGNGSFGEDKFFNSVNGVYDSFAKAMQKLYDNDNDYKAIDFKESDVWKDAFWNESISDLIKLLYSKLDPENVKKYENSGLLIELIDNDGMIDTEHLRAGINATNFGSAEKTLVPAALRITDIVNADAGNSFTVEDDMYEYGYFYDKITIYVIGKYPHAEEPVYICLKGEKVLFNEKGKTLIDNIEAGIHPEWADFLTHTESPYRVIKDYIQSGEIIEEIPKEIEESPEEYEKYKGAIWFKDIYWIDQIDSIEIIDEGTGENTRRTFKIAKNPWVVPWYNFNAETYRKVRGEDKKLSVLTDKNKLDFSCDQENKKEGSFIRLILPQYKRKVEVEDLNRNFWIIGQVLAAISAYLFDPNSVLGEMLSGLLNEIGQLWENVLFLWGNAALLAQKKHYDKIHTEIVVISETIYNPFLKYDNINSIDDNNITSHLDYLINLYPEYNLAIIPYIRKNNYEHNYYSQASFPGIYIYDRNKENPKWELKEIFNLNFQLGEFADYVYGINETEESYNYVTPLSHVKDIHGKNEIRYYGLVRDKINFTIAEDFSNPIITIDWYDVGHKLITGKNNLICRWKNAGDEAKKKVFKSEKLKNSTGEFSIIKGYYQGELLSGYNDSIKIIYNLLTLPRAELVPLLYPKDIVGKYYDGSKITEEDLNEYESLGLTASSFTDLHKKDATVLYSVLNNQALYRNNPIKFKEQFTDMGFKKSHEYGYLNGEWVKKARNDVEKYYGATDKFYDSKDSWQDVTTDYYKKLTENIDQGTLLFVEGGRFSGYSSKITEDVECVNYFPYESNDNNISSDGLYAPILRDIAASGNYIETGAAIAIPNAEGGYYTGFYANHRSATNNQIDNFYLTPYPYAVTNGRGEFQYGPEGSKEYVSIKTILDNEDVRYYANSDIAETTSTEIRLDMSSSTGGAGDSQTYVMIKKEDTELNPTNWLVIKVSRSRMGNTTYWQDGERTYFEKKKVTASLASEKDIYLQLIRKIAQKKFDNGIKDVKGLVEAVDTLLVKNGIVIPGYEKRDDNYFQVLAAQCLCHGSYDAWFKQIVQIYADEKNKVDYTQQEGYIDWETTAKALISLPTHEGSATRFKDIIDEDGTSYTAEYKDEDENPYWFITTETITLISVYAFGPEDSNGNRIYARKSYGRNIQGVFGENKIINEVGDIDELRKHYRVISTLGNENYEKYKTTGNATNLIKDWPNPGKDTQTSGAIDPKINLFIIQDDDPSYNDYDKIVEFSN